jgi:carbamoyl-phosphate synthase large subunit
MKKVLLTAVGCPGAPGVIALLQDHYDLYGVDCDELAAGLRLVNGELVPHASEESLYKKEIMRVCRERKIDLVLPMSTAELFPLAVMQYMCDNFGDTTVAVSQPGSVAVAMDKGRLYDHFKDRDYIPDFMEVTGGSHFEDFDAFVKRYDEVFVKPCLSNGSRGLYRVTYEKEAHRLDQKPAPYTTVSYDEFRPYFQPSNQRALVAPFIRGMEWSVDCVRKGDFFTSVARVRHRTRSGICTHGWILDNDTLDRYAREICEGLDLEYNINLQFIQSGSDHYLIEINPRVSGSIALSSQLVNLPWTALQFAEGVMELPEYEVPAHRSMVRYYKEVFY